MTRTITFELPTDTSLFTPLQLHPRSAGALAMGAWARWLRAHWVPFPRLIEEQRLGVVIARLEVDYLRPFGFFDSDTLVATSALRVRPDGGLMVLVTGLSPPEGPEVTCITGVLRPVSVGEGVVLSATPTNLGPDVLSRFHDDEIGTGAPRPRLNAVVGELDAVGPPLAVASREFTLHRHMCEAADQWSGIAVPDLTTEVRESIVADRITDIPSLAIALTQPMRSIAMEFRRPAFFLDEFSVECRTYATDEGLAFVHRFTSIPGQELLATVVEWFDEMSDR